MAKKLTDVLDSGKLSGPSLILNPGTTIKPSAKHGRKMTEVVKVPDKVAQRGSLRLNPGTTIQESSAKHGKQATDIAKVPGTIPQTGSADYGHQSLRSEIYPEEKKDPEKQTATEADEKLLDEARERLKDCISAESIERRKMEDDLAFCTLDQWDSKIRNERENDPNGPRPCLTIDKINQYIVQVVNDMRQNRPSIKVRPVDDAADVETAKIFQGLVRHIEDQSSASVAYETAGEWAVKVGLGYFRVVTEYANDKSSNQTICIKRIPNAFNVYLATHDMPDGSDAEYGFVFEDIPVDTFKRLHPGKKTNKEDFDDLGDALAWRTEHTIRVCEYFYAHYEESPDEELEDGSQRTVYKRSIKWCKFTGAEVLEKRDWPGKYIPIVEVVGRESFVKGKRVVWGLVRPAKDSLRMNNYWMSAITEKIGLAPKVPFIGAEGQFDGRENEWKNANRENRAYLQYKPIDINGNAIPPPQRVAPAPMEAAMAQMTVMIAQDVKASLGMYKAAVGDSESQQSGRAILALQKESDTGTMHFSDNLGLSIKYCGRILIDLIPKIIDTRQVIRILGEDGESSRVQVDPSLGKASDKVQTAQGIKSIYNLTVGDYDVTTTVGPSYTTKRQEVATLFTELANSAKDPASASVMRYIAVKNSDFEQSDEALKMLKALLPPALQQMGAQDQPIPPQVQAQMAQMKQMLQAASQKIKELETEQAPKMAKLQIDKQEGDAKLSQQQEQAIREANFDRWKALLDAKTKVVVAQIAAKQANDQALVEAENEANIEFMHAVNENDMAKTDALMSAEAPTPEDGTAMTPQPAPNLREMMNGLAQMIAQMGQMNQQMMAQAQQQHADMMKVMMRPKTVSAKMPSGATMHATVQ